MGQEKDDLYKTGDCLIEVTTWRGLTVHWNIVQFLNNIIMIKLRFSLLMHVTLADFCYPVYAPKALVFLLS
jgi:hypothetical protein